MKRTDKKKCIVIGTAGHIDHGKTWLVKALTGTDTDRLAEEKNRGITIESGFARLFFQDGTSVSMVDVPGHEKFIKNMVSGVSGIDLVLLCIAADEGIKPQTVEHLDILTFLGIKKGMVILTKIDLVSEESLAKRKEEIRALVAGTFLENSPVLETSAKRNAGIEELREKLRHLSDQIPNRNRNAPFRLPIDRVFTLKGYGTIITGTLAEGCLHNTDPAMLFPSGRQVRIRSIQTHGEDTDTGYSGQRIAVNLNGISKEEISRGEILAQTDSMQSTMMTDVSLSVSMHTKRCIKNGSRVHFYHGARELTAKIILLDRDVLLPGETAFAQLRLEAATALRMGEHFLIRFYSPVETIGGGVVLDPFPKKQKRNRPEVLLKLKDRQLQCSTMDRAVEGDTENAPVRPLNPDRQPVKQPQNKTPELFAADQEKTQRIRNEILSLYRNTGFYPPLTEDVKQQFQKEPLFPKVFFALLTEHILLRLDEKHYILNLFHEKAGAAAERLYREKGEISTGEFRDVLGISRKNAIALLEGFDKTGVTRRTPDGKRILRKSFSGGSI